VIVEDLVRWLNTQLDEDERIARACPGDGEWEARHIEVYGPDLSTEVRAHMAVHDPARVLREIDAKRRTLLRCQEEMFSGIPRLTHFAKQTVREMAAVYKDRPGYEAALAAFE
jgi:hypothetical protein